MPNLSSSNPGARTGGSQGPQDFLCIGRPRVNLEELVIPALACALWPSLTLAVVALWTAAALDILRHKRRGTFSNKGLLGMAVVVSVVAGVGISGICAVFAGQWSEAVSSASNDGIQASKPADEDSSRAYIFSFGMENASYGPPLDSTGANGSKNRQSR
jgi:hypothetical protein